MWAGFLRGEPVAAILPPSLPAEDEPDAHQPGHRGSNLGFDAWESVWSYRAGRIFIQLGGYLTPRFDKNEAVK